MSHALVIVTGASRGFGAALAVAFARVLGGERLTLLLLARDLAGLGATADAVRAAAAGATVLPRRLDLGDLDALEGAWDAVLRDAAGAGPFDAVYLANNHGSLGEIHAVRQLSSLGDLRRAVDMNVTATVWITSAFLKFVRGGGGGGCGTPTLAPPPARAAVVNVSSLAAIQPLAHSGVYCVGKAARDMLHAVVADEEAGDGGVGALNYAPGPMDTAMQAEIRGCPHTHGPTREFFQEMAAKGTYVDTHASAAKCVRVLLAGRFKSGQHLDFYDDEP
jgi:sepiapterin reductase